MLRCGRNFKRFCYHLFVTLVGTRPAPEGVGAKAITHETGKSKTCVWLWRKRLASGRFGRLLRDKTRRSRIAKLHSAIEERVVVLTMEAPLARPAIGPAQSWPNRLASGSVGRARVEPPHMSPSFWNRDRAKHVAHCPGVHSHPQCDRTRGSGRKDRPCDPRQLRGSQASRHGERLAGAMRRGRPAFSRYAETHSRCEAREMTLCCRRPAHMSSS